MADLFLIVDFDWLMNSLSFSGSKCQEAPNGTSLS